ESASTSLRSRGRRLYRPPAGRWGDSFEDLRSDGHGQSDRFYVDRGRRPSCEERRKHHYSGRPGTVRSQCRQATPRSGSSSSAGTCSAADGGEKIRMESGGGQIRFGAGKGGSQKCLVSCRYRSDWKNTRKRSRGSFLTMNRSS